MSNKRTSKPPAVLPPQKRQKTTKDHHASGAHSPAIEVKTESELVDLADDQVPREPTPLPADIADFSKSYLPTLSRPQPYDLSNDEYKSIQDSNILAASLERSRQRWVSGQFFRRYWTKVGTKKDAPAVGKDQPQKAWMKEIGTCTITIEPLVYEATVFYSKEPSIVQAQQQQQPIKPHTVASSLNAPSSSASSQYGTPYQPAQLSSVNPKASARSSPASSIRPDTNTSAGPSPATTRPPSRDQASEEILPSKEPTDSALDAGPVKDSIESGPEVVQMLAQRAATDSSVKTLMQIVATGTATKEHIDAFQVHIEDINAILKTKMSQKTPHSTPSGTRPISAMTGPQPPQPSRPKPLPQSLPSYPVALEFHGPNASTDRFLFPQNSLIEQVSPHSVMASFLIERKGREASGHDRSLLDAEKEYYEPVTIRIDVTPRNKQVLEYLRRSVGAVEKVQAHMRTTIDRCQRVEPRFLALRLPFENQIPAHSRLGSEMIPPSEPLMEKSKAAKKKTRVKVADPPREEGKDALHKGQVLVESTLQSDRDKDVSDLLAQGEEGQMSASRGRSSGRLRKRSVRTGEF